MLSRRTLLRTIGGAAGASLVGVAPAAASRCNSERPFDQQLQQVEQATKRYRDMEKALKDGYQIMGPYVPAMGWHFIHPERAKRAAEKGPNPVQPSALTYNLDGELGSAEYLVPADRQPDLFTDEDADREVKVPESEAWHVHHEAQHVFSNGDGTVDQQPSRDELLNPNNWVELSDHNDQMPETVDGLEPGDSLEVPWGLERTVEERIVDMVSTHPSQNTLHAWEHTENPHGVFAGFNPAFDRFDPPGGGHDHEH